MSESKVDDSKGVMQPNPARAKHLLENLSGVTARIQRVAAGRPVRLVAVSKLKPASDVLALHQHQQPQPQPHLHFGENYVQELQEKAALLPPSVRWHFIGGLQTNKCAALSHIPNLYLVSSLDTVKKADALNRGRAKLLEERPKPSEDGLARLNVHVQVNTSGEENKAGVEPAETTALCRHILDACPHLHLQGLMTIGAIARSKAAAGPDSVNEDFVLLKRIRDEVTEKLGSDRVKLELSMGMSDDFEGAIELGADEVRVGSTIFGERPPKSEAKV